VKLIIILINILFFTIIQNDSNALFRCDNGRVIIDKGETRTTLFSKCRQPDNKSFEIIDRKCYFVLYYDLGPNEFTQTIYIRCRSEEIVWIIEGGYGTYNGKCPNKECE
jgi:hypothetical protein